MVIIYKYMIIEKCNDVVAYNVLSKKQSLLFKAKGNKHITKIYIHSMSRQ